MWNSKKLGKCETTRADHSDGYIEGYLYVTLRKANYSFLFTCIHMLWFSSSTFQSSEGSFTKTSMVLSSRSGSSLKARSECTITLWMRPDSAMGRIKFINCRVSLNGIISGTGRNYMQHITGYCSQLLIKSSSQAVYQSCISKLVQ